MYCMQCGQPLQDEAQQCPHCHTPIPGREPITEEQELAALLGPNNQQWYLQRFARFAQGGSSLGWHWPSLFVTFFWLLYRKMWLAALVYFFAPSLLAFLIGFITGLIAPDSPAVTTGGALILWLLVLLLPPMLATRLYYQHCQRKLAQLRLQEPDARRRLGLLQARGGTSSLVLVVLPILLLFLIGILAAIAIPAYQDYTVRARLNGAMLETQRLTLQLDDYYRQHQQLPSTLDEIGFQLAPHSTIGYIDYAAQPGQLVIKPSVNQLPNASLRLQAHSDDQGALRWHCQADQIPQRQRPAQCP